MHTPKLSVIVANYNNERYIRDCLDSILNQTYKDLEILVCDDCSSDSSLSILMGYEKKYPLIVKVIQNASNLGVSQTRHNAILQAVGEYITTLDSDDYFFDSQKLEREMELVLDYKKEKAVDVIAFSNIVMVSEDKAIMNVRGNSDNIREGRIIKEIMARSCLVPRDFIVKRDKYFEVGGFDAGIPIYEDWDLKIRLANQCNFYFSGVNGTAYRRHGNGLSAAPISEHIEWQQKIFCKNSSLLGDGDLVYVETEFSQYILRLKKRAESKKKSKNTQNT